MIKIEDNAQEVIESLGTLRAAYPKETDTFLKSEAKKLRSNVVRNTRSNVKKHTGNLLKGIKTSRKPYSIQNERKIRVYAGKPGYHANLVEKGHNVYKPKGNFTGKRTKAYNMFKNAEDAFESTFISDCGEMVDKLIKL